MGSTRRHLPMRTTSRPVRDPTITGSTVIGHRTTVGIPGLPDTGTGSNSAAATKSRRTLTTGSMIAITGEALLEASTKSETVVLARVETAVGRTATKPAYSIKASRAILGGIRPRLRAVETATGPAKTRVVKAIAKKTALQADSEPANRRIYEQPPIKDEPAARATGFSAVRALQARTRSSHGAVLPRRSNVNRRACQTPHRQCLNHRGKVVVSAGTYVMSNTPTAITKVSGVTALNTSGTDF